MKFAVQAALGILVMLCFSVIGAQAEELTPPEELGISAERLQRVDRVASRYVEEGRVMGMVTMITRHGKLVQTSAQGVLGMDNELPMQADTLFRVYSMTKAVTAVAALILYEEGHFHLDDPVEKFLPNFKDMQVYENGALRPAKIKM
ncbi:MAG: serine hydrolase domain-containing protein, partial [bacterium]